MSDKPPVYLIRTVADIANIAPEHREEFFAGFRDAMSPLLEIFDRMRELDFGDLLEHPSIKDLHIVFTPDGKPDVGITITTAPEGDA